MNIVSYTTNQSSLLVQKNLTKSTNALNTAIERLTTGYKINGAKDNAANYSITQNMSVNISAYQVAEENAMMGLDMVQTANAGFEQITYLTERLKTLAVQSQNGTYGEESIKAINSEVESIVAEINRISQNTEYNGIGLLNGLNVTSYLKSEILQNASRYYGTSYGSMIDALTAAASSAGEISGTSGASGASDASGASGGSGANEASWGTSGITFNVSDSDNLNAVVGTFSPDKIQVTGSITRYDVVGCSSEYNINSVLNPSSGTDYRDSGIGYASHAEGMLFNASGASGYASIENKDNFIKPVCHHDVADSAIRLSEAPTADGGERIAEGAYTINDSNDLLKLKELYTAGWFVGSTKNYSFIMTSDIDMEGVEWNDPIGSSRISFDSLFDGNGYVIKNLNGFSLFGEIGENGKVCNLGVEDAQANTLSAAILCRYNRGTIENCYTTGVVSYGNYVSGGLVFSNGGTINDSYTKAVGSDSTNDCRLYYENFGTVSNSYDFDITGAKRVSEVSEFSTGHAYKIEGLEDLERLRVLVNSGNSTAGCYFALTNDINFGATSYGYWTGIGSADDQFMGIFDGQGYTISNLTINSSNSYQGLFRFVGSSGIVKNLSLENVNIDGVGFAGGIAGSSNGNIMNCSVSGNVSGHGSVGGLVGCTSGDIINCSATGTVSGSDTVGGLVGYSDGNITNCYSTSSVNNSGTYTGGLVGYINGYIMNSYATGNVTGANSNVGGLVGYSNSYIMNCYATGNVIGADCNGENTGGLVGFSNGHIISSYATGSVNGRNNTGGLVGETLGNVINSYATGTVLGEGDNVGGLAGSAYMTILNSYASGSVKGNNNNIGGLAGSTEGDIRYSYATGDVKGVYQVGGLVGWANQISTHNSNIRLFGNFSSGKVTGQEATGGLIGAANTSMTIDNCFTLSKVEGFAPSGALCGYSGNLNIYSSGYSASQNSGLNAVGYSNPDTSVSINYLRSDLSEPNKNVSIQVGINSSSSSQIEFTISTPENNLDSIVTNGIEAEGTIALLDSYLQDLYSAQTTLGAVENRLTSALESISVSYDNLVSSRSTLRDADIAEISSQYIRQQILQQAAATLLATANQNPSIALQLI